MSHYVATIARNWIKTNNTAQLMADMSYETIGHFLASFNGSFRSYRTSYTHAKLIKERIKRTSFKSDPDS